MTYLFAYNVLFFQCEQDFQYEKEMNLETCFFFTVVVIFLGVGALLCLFVVVQLPGSQAPQFALQISFVDIIVEF